MSNFYCLFCASCELNKKEYADHLLEYHKDRLSGSKSWIESDSDNNDGKETDDSDTFHDAVENPDEIKKIVIAKPA
jgi:hypothetical protein